MKFENLLPSILLLFFLLITGGMLSTTQAQVATTTENLSENGLVTGAALQPIVAEAFWRSFFESVMSTSEGETREKARVTALAQSLQLGEVETRYLLVAGHNFGQAVIGLDQAAQTIKMQNGFQITLKVRDQLTKLQQQKAKLLQETTGAFVSKLDEKNRKKIEAYFEETVKPGLKILAQPTTPLAEKNKESIPSSSYSYTATVISWDRLEVYGWGIVIEDYLTEGRDYRLNCSNVRTAGVLSSNASTAFAPAPVQVTTVTPLQHEGTYYAGQFVTTCNVESQGAIVR